MVAATVTLTPAWTYAATIVRWVDGDTVDLRVDPGFHLTLSDRFRLYGVNTPERGQPGYAEATAACVALAPAGSPVVVKTYAAPEKYGRWLAQIWVADVEVSAYLIEHSLGVPYFGGTKI